MIGFRRLANTSVSLLAPYQHLHCWSFSRLFLSSFYLFGICILYSYHPSRSLFLGSHHPLAELPYFIVNIENLFFPSLYLFLLLFFFTLPSLPSYTKLLRTRRGLLHASFFPPLLLSIFSGGRFYLFFCLTKTDRSTKEWGRTGRCGAWFIRWKLHFCQFFSFLQLYFLYSPLAVICYFYGKCIKWPVVQYRVLVLPSQLLYNSYGEERGVFVTLYPA